MAMVDPTQILWEHLTATGTDLYSLVGARVWCPQAPKGWRNTSAAVLYEIVDESLHVTASDARCLVQFFCYGGDDTHASARAVYEALNARLHGPLGVRVASGGISDAQLVNGHPGQVEPESEWKYCGAMYRLRATA